MAARWTRAFVSVATVAFCDRIDYAEAIQKLLREDRSVSALLTLACFDGCPRSRLSDSVVEQSILGITSGLPVIHSTLAQRPQFE
jgi:hypothetical protein